MYGFVCICCCPIDELCPTLCDPMDCDMQGLPVLHHLPDVFETKAVESGRGCSEVKGL